MPDKHLISGVYELEFYKLLEKPLALAGYDNIADYIQTESHYWHDEEAWRKIFAMAPMENEERTFAQRIGSEYVPILAAYVSDDAEFPLIPTSGAEIKTNQIPRMGRASAFDMDAFEKLKKLASRGIDVNDMILDTLTMELKKLTQTVHSQTSFSAFQILSKGSFYTSRVRDGGIDNFLIDLHPVADNRKKCGGFWVDGQGEGTKNAWSSANADPIGDLVDMFEYGWVNRKISRDPKANIYEMSASLWKTLYKHSATRVRVAMWKTGGVIDADNITNYKVSPVDVSEYLKTLNIPEVIVRDYYGWGSAVNPDTLKIESTEQEAFDPNTVVLRANSLLGEIQWTKVSNLNNSSIAPIFYAEGGSIAIQQDLGKKGTHYSVESLRVPVPDQIQRVLYLTTNEAAA